MRYNTANLKSHFPANLRELERRSSSTPDEQLEIAFEPVPRLLRRRGGWSEERQRAFIAALARCGSVSAAARSVGKSARGAYKLLDAPGADDFARAWDEAVELGFERLRMDSLDRALRGDLVPVYRRGRLVRVEHRRNDKLAIALLSGRGRAIEDNRRNAVSRRQYREELKADDERRAAEQRRRDEIWAQHQVILDRIEAERKAPKPRAEPRITRL